MAEIERRHITTKNGNTISLFYCTVNDLVVVDLNAKDGSGGNELLRCYMEEEKLLYHCVHPSRINTTTTDKTGDQDHDRKPTA